MYLQGNLQAIFDALYHMGIIDPVLEMDWNKALDQMEQYADDFFQVLSIANSFQDDMEMLMSNLKKFDQKTLSYLAMEVAREYADYHSRETLH
jgi:NTP pyrophosphatase (non-canonical NTP hydrolase)